MIDRFLSQRRCVFVWIGWTAANFAMAYFLRFWVNSDTVGSLDSALALQSFQLEAVNASWGSGLAFVLALLPLEHLESWLLVHLLVTVVLLLSQIFLYKSLRQVNCSRSIAVSLTLVWGASCYSTGSAIFVTADLILGFLASLYLFTAVKTDWFTSTPRFSRALVLGSLHGLSGLTKTIAFPGLMVFPVVLGVIHLRRAVKSEGRLKALRKLLFLGFGYIVPLVLIAASWGYLCEKKYGRFTLGDSGSYTYAKWVEGSEEVFLAEEVARKELPPWGVYWWSDFALSVQRSDYSVHFDPLKQLRVVLNNLVSFALGRHFREGFPILFVCLFGFLAWLIVRKEKKIPLTPFALALTCPFVLGLYLATLFFSRYFPFAVMFALPFCGYVFSVLTDQGREPWKSLTRYVLILVLFHGTAIMVVAAAIAPGGQHFQVARQIRSGSSGPIGAYADPGISLLHYGIVAFLAGRQAAEMEPTDSSYSRFTATFRPSSVLLVVDLGQLERSEVQVDGRVFVLGDKWVHSKGLDETKLLLYLPTDQEL